MIRSSEPLQFALSLSESEKELPAKTISHSRGAATLNQAHPDAEVAKDRIATEECERRYVRAFITAFNFPSTLDELRFNYLLEGAYLDIETLLYRRFREGIKVGWTVPKWAKPGDVCMFYFAKTADAKLRSVQRELDIRRGDLDWSTERCLDIMLRRGWHYFDKYSRTILAIGRVAGAPYHFDGTEELSHFKSPVYAEIDGIVALENPLHISEFRDVVFIKRSGTITPVFGREFDVVRERIMRNNKAPDYFADCSTKPIPLRGINKENWMSVAREHRTGFLLEQEFRACYVDYLLQSISDDGFVYCECRTKKKTGGKARKGFVDNAIRFHGKYLPVEVKFNAEAEHNLPAQCERYCHLGNLFLTNDLSVSRRKVYGGNVLVVDTMALYMYSSKDRSIVRILELDSISEGSLDVVKARLQEALNRAG